ncbi:hypothetical protein Daus18300_006397 [Diaporthe australafricana]|uniref:Uncharacterized protein n=1 Tax=Diaporthe australafricana TaxID=127596 RepID=A0ABR3WUM0_9PEZI
MPTAVKKMPGEIQDMILSYLLCSFPRPETTDPANDGKYIGEYVQCAHIPWNIDLRALDDPDPWVRKRASRVMLTINQFICVKSASINLLPMFNAAQVPIVASRLGPFGGDLVEKLSSFFILTHQIEKLGIIDAPRPSFKSSMTSTPKPWGRSLEYLKMLKLAGETVPEQQEFVILRRDLDIFCRALDGADSGYYQFGACTENKLTLHGPFRDILDEGIPIFSPSRFLQPYRATLRGFENFTVQSRIEDMKEALDISKEVRETVATPRIGKVVEDANRQMSKGDVQMALDQHAMAAHTHARASQELVWLYSRGILPRETADIPSPLLAELFFILERRQAAAWIEVLEKVKAAIDKAAQNGPDDAQARGELLKHCCRRCCVDLVYDTLMHQPPPPLRHLQTPQQTAMMLYQAAKSERLGDVGSKETWSMIHRAQRLAPQNLDIRCEAALIDKRVRAWDLRWISEDEMENNALALQMLSGPGEARDKWSA